MSERWKVIEGDCLAVLPTLGAESVDAVVTDPPYGTGAWKRSASGQGSDCSATHQIEMWDVWRTDWLDLAWRVSRGRMGIFCAQRNLPSLFAWAGDRPWRLCFWRKTDPRPRFGAQPAYAFECFLAVGGTEACGLDVIEASAPRLNRDHDGTGHPHQKPIEAARWAVNMLCPVGGSVLDPFCGSGTTGVACAESGRRFFGIEREPEYAAIARARIAAAVADVGLFANTEGGERA